MAGGFYTVGVREGPVPTKNSIEHKNDPPLGRLEARGQIQFWLSYSPSFLGDRRSSRLKNGILREQRVDDSWVRPNVEDGPRSSGSSFVSVVKSADLWDGDDSSDWLHRPRYRSVLVERKVSSRSVIVVEVGTKNSAK